MATKQAWLVAVACSAALLFGSSMAGTALAAKGGNGNGGSKASGNGNRNSHQGDISNLGIGPKAYNKWLSDLIKE